MTAITVFLTFLLLVITLSAVAGGGYLLHRRMHFLEEEHRRLRLASVEDVQQFEKQIRDLTIRLESTERRASDTSVNLPTSLNYTQRSQMLRLIRRGDPPAQIASILSVPLSQVRLLMKLPGAKPATKQKGQGAGQ